MASAKYCLRRTVGPSARSPVSGSVATRNPLAGSVSLSVADAPEADFFVSLTPIFLPMSGWRTISPSKVVPAGAAIFRFTFLACGESL